MGLLWQLFAPRPLRRYATLPGMPCISSVPKQHRCIYRPGGSRQDVVAFVDWRGGMEADRYGCTCGNPWSSTWPFRVTGRGESIWHMGRTVFRTLRDA